MQQKYDSGRHHKSLSCRAESVVVPHVLSMSAACGRDSWPPALDGTTVQDTSRRGAIMAEFSKDDCTTVGVLLVLLCLP